MMTVYRRRLSVEIDLAQDEFTFPVVVQAEVQEISHPGDAGSFEYFPPIEAGFEQAKANYLFLKNKAP